ncbi:MAG: hypothetical protein IJT87_05345 [Ruminiclostridium sp.]|nr:hypothetical protein [Ruminiclostridium sp.]
MNNKDDKNKKKFRIPHRLVFILSLLGVVALMALYIWFVSTWMNDDVYTQESGYGTQLEFPEPAVTLETQ